MKFETAFNKAFETEEKRVKKENPHAKFAVKPDTARIFAFIWNMISASGGKFDDMVFIDKNNNIVSIPIESEKKGTKEPDIDTIGENNDGKTKKKAE